MARRLRGRPVNGIVLLDKPGGMSSNAALQKVKNLFAARKAGHTGSLDPIATGLLPVCLGEATKISAFLLDADKGYETLIRLGQCTATGDIEGDVIEERPVPALDASMLEAVLARFRGAISQTPPMYSAIKQNGQPLYKLARQGVEVERAARNVTIHALELLAWDELHLRLSVKCSKGTYIRVLAEDIGEALGCGAHVLELRRTLAMPFELQQARTLDELQAIKGDGGFESLDATVLAMESALVDWPEVRLNADMEFFVKRGQAVLVPKAPLSGLVMLMGEQSGFMGIGHILDDGRVAPKRMMVSEPDLAS